MSKCPSLSVNSMLMTSDMTSSPRDDIAVLGKIFQYFSTLKYQDDFCQKFRNCLNLSKLCLEYCGLFFPGHGVYMHTGRANAI